MTSQELINPRSFIIRKVVDRSGTLSINLPRKICDQAHINPSDYMIIQYEDTANRITFSKLKGEKVLTSITLTN
jgi:hypothetical protein